MRKILPIFLSVLGGLAVVGGVFWLLRPAPETSEEPGPAPTKVKEEKTVKELPLEERPFVSLVPGPSCEYTLNVSGIKKDASELEYEVVYKVDSGITQGVPGTVKLAGKTSITRDLLFGTESSGHRRCDKGVKDGTITIKYRDDDGKLIAKIEGNFQVKESAKALKIDGFELDLGKIMTEKYVVMNTIGLPGKPPGEVTVGPFGVFSAKSKVSAEVTISGEGDIYMWDKSKWVKLTDGKTTSLGTFIKIK